MRNIPVFNGTVRSQDRVLGGTTTDPIGNDFAQTSTGTSIGSVTVRQCIRPKWTGGAIIRLAKHPRRHRAITRATSTGNSTIVSSSITDSTRGHFRTFITGRQTKPTTQRSACACTTRTIIVVCNASISDTASRNTIQSGVFNWIVIRRWAILTGVGFDEGI